MTDEEALELVRERGIAMAEAAARHPGSMAAILGLEDEVVETLCRKILGVWPANYTARGRSSSPASTPPSMSAASWRKKRARAAP